MVICTLDKSDLQKVAYLMTRLKPEFWSLEGAVAQLSNGVAWYAASDDGDPMGWLLCQWYEAYKTVEIECLGYDDNGQFKVGPELQPLMARCERWAQEQGAANLRFIIGSRGLSCHGRKLGRPWEELKEILAIDREGYDWFLSMGYAPSGILPDIYGPGYHGVMLLKHLSSLQA